MSIEINEFLTKKNNRDVLILSKPNGRKKYYLWWEDWNDDFLIDFSKKSNSSRSVGWMNCD